VRELAHGDTDPDRVVGQTPVAGQQLRKGASVSFAVSAGPPEPRVPPVSGLSVGMARELLERVGFAVEVTQNRSTDVPGGVVDHTDPPAGAPRPLPSTVTLVVSAGTPADSASPDTVRSPFPDSGPGR
ncbi:MAG: PASTA domain-containing protein, partial [Gemmatimonadetes bacterium]|nr:PASTA domain-containing protein [Gemmatimonadota bacterium]NIQ57657.1 PASTA domain-containing protein [Gemmatimonadota bacterium]NIU77824.1 PASTA domain-containing protein [Gammaproteobacteria bacterium]NIX46952.1 PASTA domain-containing protein [Gemmatimonadota bacterium]NIY11305.1 PASTA domain-containing protein [Gemmatimonadota bacterium]